MKPRRVVDVVAGVFDGEIEAAHDAEPEAVVVLAPVPPEGRRDEAGRQIEEVVDVRDSHGGLDPVDDRLVA